MTPAGNEEQLSAEGSHRLCQMLDIFHALDARDGRVSRHIDLSCALSPIQSPT